jgi:hypothetical protein
MLYRDLRGWVGRKRRELQLQAYESVTVDGTGLTPTKKSKRNKKKPVVAVESCVVHAPDKATNLAEPKPVIHESSASETEIETEDEEAENTDHGIDARLLSDAEVDATDNEEPESAAGILTQSSAEPMTQPIPLVPSIPNEKQNTRPLDLIMAGPGVGGPPYATPPPAVSSPVSAQSVASGSRNQGDPHAYNGNSRQAMSRPAETGTLPSPVRGSQITQPYPQLPPNPLQLLRRHNEYPPRPGSTSSPFAMSVAPPPASVPGKDDTATRAKLLLDSIANDSSRGTSLSQQRSAVPASLQMRPSFANVTPQPPVMPPQHAPSQSRPATFNDPRFGPLGQIPMNGPHQIIPSMPPQHGPPIPLNGHPGGPFPPIQRPVPVNAMPSYSSGSAPSSATDPTFTIRRASLPFQDGPQPPFLAAPPHGPAGPMHLQSLNMNGFQLPPQMQFPPPLHPHSAPPPGSNNVGPSPPNPALLEALLERTPRASHVNPPNTIALPVSHGHAHLPVPQPQAQVPPRRVVPHASQLLALFGGDAPGGSNV